MKSKKTLIIPFLLGIFLVSFVSALEAGNITIVIPAASATIGQNLSINVTYTNGPYVVGSHADANYTKAFFYINSSSTNISGAYAYNISSDINWTTMKNPTGNNRTAEWQSFLNATLIQDSNDYTFVAILSNGTNNVSKQVTITIDNTVPRLPTSLTPTSVTNSSPVLFSSTIVDNSTTGCILIFPNRIPGLNKFNTMTHTSGTSTCTFTLNSIGAESYQYIVQAGDGSNYTNSSEATLTVGGKTGKGGAKYVATQLAKRKAGPFAIFTNPDGTWSTPSVIVLALIIMAIVIWLKRNKVI